MNPKPQPIWTNDIRRRIERRMDARIVDLDNAGFDNWRETTPGGALCVFAVLHHIRLACEKAR